MRNFRPRPVSVIVAACLAVSWSLVSGQPRCPPALARLMPANAGNVTGQFNVAGDIVIGFAAGGLPFDNPCDKSTKYPGHISFDVKRYQGQATKIFTMQIDSEESQRVTNAQQELARKLKGGGAKVSTEKTGAATLVYYEISSDCEEFGGKKYIAQLVGVAHNPTTAINITIDGFISAAVAKSAAREVLGNFAKFGVQ